MGKITHKTIGCWNVTQYNYNRFSKQEKLAIEFVEKFAHSYGMLDLKYLFTSLKDYIQRDGVKDTVEVVHLPGAYLAGSMAVDHYKVVIRQKSRGWSMIISEPIGTDINRHKLANQ